MAYFCPELTLDKRVIWVYTEPFSEYLARGEHWRPLFLASVNLSTRVS